MGKITGFLEFERNDRDYEPANCHWSTPAEQQANTSKVRYLTFRDITLSITEWARVFDLPADTIRMRLAKLGYSVEKALTAPLQRQNHRTRRKDAK